MSIGITDVVFAGLVVVAGAALISLLMALPLMWLWDALMPDLFGLETITFWQALGINLLSGIIFGRGSVATTTKKN